MNNKQNEELLQFPCDFAIKVLGDNTPDFEIEVLTIIRQFITDLKENAIKNKDSKNGKYRSLTVSIHAQSRNQLDDIYRALNASPLVKMTL